MAAILTFYGPARAADSPREQLSLDSGWKFHLGDEWGFGEQLAKSGDSGGPAKSNFNDSAWRTLNLPHDWVVELLFDANSNYDHGYKPVGPGYQSNSIGWYRRAFELTSSDRGRRLWLEFGGVYRDCRVFLNGFELAHHESGYNSFRCDITDVADCGGKNVLAVRVDASQFEGWFYEGAGIYRHVNLIKTSPLAISPDGVFVWTSFEGNTPGGQAGIHATVQLMNSQKNPVDATVNYSIKDPDGKTIGEFQDAVKLDPWSQKEVSTDSVKPILQLSNYELWSPESPKLYTLVTTIKTGTEGQIVDSKETEFGIRTVGFDTTDGFLLNGKRYAIKGTCNHQDHAGVGIAMPDAIQNFRVAKLKEMGCNAIRTSHNEPTAELLNACDRLGLLVMDENRRLGSDSKNLEYLEQQIRRDRNHPSVFIWSLANEEHSVQRSAVGARVIDGMQNLVHQLDPTRLCTAAMDGRAEDEKADGFSSVLDVQGFNYIHRGDMDAFHKANPGIPCIGTEEASAYYTRGTYENTKTYESAYEGNKPDYGTTAEEWWTYYSARPWASGSFVWTGFDYRGESSPFHWPNISSELGILDTCGSPKDHYYYYQSWWTDKPVLHLLPHWNWPGKEGQDIDVRAFSNCHEVELFLNGQTLGKKQMVKNSHLQWTVKYAPGTLSAKGYTDGKVTAEAKVETTGVPAAVQLNADRSTLAGDGVDCSVVTVSIADANGRIVPTANNHVHFVVTGPGRIIGVGNGDPICHEPDVYIDKPFSRTISLDTWRMAKVADTNNRPEVAEDYQPKKWARVNVNDAEGPLNPGESAVYRSHISLSDQDLTATDALLHIGLIDDEGWVYVNGKIVGESHDWRVSPSFNVLKFLHAGDNILAVVVKNTDGPGGLNKSATLELDQKPIATDWQRSVFNGLGQVIVQAGKGAGEIHLSARADGLATTTISILAKPDAAELVAPPKP